MIAIGSVARILMLSQLLSTSHCFVGWTVTARRQCVRSISSTKSWATVEADAVDPKQQSSSRRRRDLWITCSTTEELISAVKTFVKPGDHVVEIGSQLRGLSSAICSTVEGSGGRATLMDVIRKPPKMKDHRTKGMRVPGEEKNFYPDVANFFELSDLNQWKQVLLQSSSDHTMPDVTSSNLQNCNVLVLDVSLVCGNDLDMTSLSIAREFSSLFDQCQVILIKSAALNQWASRLKHAQNWISAHKDPHNDRSGMSRMPPPHIIGTVGVQEYRDVIPYCVQAGDAVLEVGCHLGTTTALLQAAAEAPPEEREDATASAGYAIGVDVGPKIIDGARQRYPHLAFAVGDAWKIADLLRIQSANTPSSSERGDQRRIGFDVVFVDVGGLSGSDGLFEALMLLSSILNGFEPRCIVIKSLCVRRLSSSLVPFWQYQKTKLPLR